MITSCIRQVNFATEAHTEEAEPMARTEDGGAP